MAPRRGSFISSGGSHSSSAINCIFCNVDFQLFGYHWHHATVTALFVFEVLCAAALLAALILSCFFHWIRPTGRPASARTGIFNIAAVFMLLYFLVRLIDTGLREEETDVTYLYNIIYIFQSLFWRIGEILLLGVVFRTVQVQHHLSDPVAPPAIAKALKPTSIIVILIEFLLTLVGFALITAGYTYRIINGPFTDFEFNRFYEEGRVETPYQVIYFLSSVLLLICTVLLFRPAHNHLSSLARLLLTIAIGALVVREFFNFIDQAVSTYSKSYNKSVRNFDWATQYFYAFTNIAIFLALALFACQRPRGESVHRQSVVPGKALGYSATAAHGPAVPAGGVYGSPAANTGMAMHHHTAPGWKGKYWYGYQGAPPGAPGQA